MTSVWQAWSNHTHHAVVSGLDSWKQPLLRRMALSHGASMRGYRWQSTVPNSFAEYWPATVPATSPEMHSAYRAGGHHARTAGSMGMKKL